MKTVPSLGLFHQFITKSRGKHQEGGFNGKSVPQHKRCILHFWFCKFHFNKNGSHYLQLLQTSTTVPLPFKLHLQFSSSAHEEDDLGFNTMHFGGSLFLLNYTALQPLRSHCSSSLCCGIVEKSFSFNSHSESFTRNSRSITVTLQSLKVSYPDGF